MPRIRTIKPEFWQDEKVAPLAPLTRLVFLGLISQADDAGRLVDSVRMLDGLLFPFSDDTCGPALDELAALERIQRYQTDSGQRLIQITGWSEHQKVKNPSQFVLPGPDDVGAQQDTGPSVGPPESLRRDTVEPNPRARAPAAPTQGILDPRSGIVDPQDELGVWLGEHAEFVAGIDAAQRGPIYQAYGPPGMRANAWAKPDGSSVPPSERPRILAVALSSYLAETKGRYTPNEFAGMLRGVIRGEYPAERGPPKGSEAADHTADSEKWRDVKRRHREWEQSEIRRLTITTGQELEDAS